MNIGDRVQYIYDNRLEDGMLLYGNTGIVTRIAEKYNKPYVEVKFDYPIYKDYEDYDGRHFFCFEDHLKIIE